MIFGLSMPELIVILAVVLVIFGPKNLPKLGKSLGKTAKSIREGMDEAEAEAGKDKALLDLCLDVIYHNNMKAFGLHQLTLLYIDWVSKQDQQTETES